MIENVSPGRLAPASVDERGVLRAGILSVARESIVAAHREKREVRLVDAEMRELSLVASSDSAAPRGRLANVPTTLIVGRDGIHGRWLFSRYAIPLAGLHAIELRIGGVVLRYAGASAVFVPIGPYARAHALRDEMASRLAAFARAGDPETLARELRCGGRTIEQWLADARALERDGESYRAAAAPREALWRIVQSGVADAEEPFGAAVAVATDEGSRARVAEVARAIARPALREALEAIAEGEELDARVVRAVLSREA